MHCRERSNQRNGSRDRHTVPITHYDFLHVCISDFILHISTTLIINVNIITVMLGPRSIAISYRKSNSLCCCCFCCCCQLFSSSARLPVCRRVYCFCAISLLLLFCSFYFHVILCNSHLCSMWLLFLSLFAYNNRYLNLHFIVYQDFCINRVSHHAIVRCHFFSAFFSLFLTLSRLIIVFEQRIHYIDDSNKQLLPTIICWRRFSSDLFL